MAPHQTADILIVTIDGVVNPFPPVVKLLSKRWWIPVGERLERPKLEPEGPKAEVGFPTADQM